MKKLIFILAIILSITVFGQKNSTSNTVKLPNGNYKEITYDSITGTTLPEDKAIETQRSLAEYIVERLNKK